MGQTTKIFCLLRCVCISLTLVVVGMSNSAYAQQFKLVEDTVLINASDFISPISTFEMKWAAKYHGYYFCIFQEQQIYGYGFRGDDHRLLVISEDEKNVVEVKLPKDFQDDYHGDLFVRHDTLYLRPYQVPYKQNGYWFDMDTWKWVPVNEVSNVIYEDDMYSVAVINVGEWGTYTWFIEKNVSNVYIQENSMSSIISDIGDNTTSVRIKPFNAEVKDVCNQYVMPGMLSRIIKKDSVYYCIRGNKVDTLATLNGKAKLCDENETYQSVIRDKLRCLYQWGTYGNTDFNGLSPIPTMFKFVGREDNNNWWGERTYDTVFFDAFLINGEIYYLVNNQKQTVISKIKDGKLQEKFDLGHRYGFFKMHDSFRGINLAPNPCFQQLEKDKNSYGVLEIQDTIIHIFHIIHNQDTLPYIGTDNIEPRLKFLLDHLENLKFSQIDSVEKSLRATGQGDFRDLANGYYPDKYQTGKYERYSYYTVIDSKKTLSVDYCVHKSNSVVRGAFFDWVITKHYNSDTQVWRCDNDNVKPIVEKVRRILTRQIGKEPVKSNNGAGKIQYFEWNYNQVKVKLYEDGRMVMYLTDN